MSASGVTLSRCGVIATTMDIRTKGRAGRLGERMTAVIVEGQRGEEYRLPTKVELQSAAVTEDELDDWHVSSASLRTTAARSVHGMSVGEKLRNTFARFALPMVWDYCEVNPVSESSGRFSAMMEWVVRYVDHATSAVHGAPPTTIRLRSAIDLHADAVDVICTDPPYYDASPTPT